MICRGFKSEMIYESQTYPIKSNIVKFLTLVLSHSHSLVRNFPSCVMPSTLMNISRQEELL